MLNPLSLCPNTSFFHYEKYIRFFTHNTTLFGKAFVVNLSTKQNIMIDYFERFFRSLGVTGGFSDFVIFFFYGGILLLILLSFLLRKAPGWSSLWWFFKWVFIGLFIMLTVNYAKKELKGWWNKD